MLNKIFIVVLVTYSALLTGQKIYDLGVADGAEQGFAVGVQQGFNEGKRQACMVKPI